jgi:hypothetical protein
VVDAAHGAAEGPLKAQGSPSVGVCGFDGDGDSPAHKSESDRVIRVRNAIASPCVVERFFIDETAQLCDEPLHNSLHSFGRGDDLLSNSLNGSSPPEQEKVVAAESAPER